MKVSIVQALKHLSYVQRLKYYIILLNSANSTCIFSFIYILLSHNQVRHESFYGLTKMNNDGKLGLGEKLKQIRLAKGIKQNVLAKALKCSEPTVTRHERHMHCDADTLKKIKNALGVPKAPLFDDEIIAFRERLYLWRDTMRNRLFDEAKKMQAELSVILYMPFEQDLALLYKLYEVKLAIAEGHAQLATEMLDTLESGLCSASKENLYHYHYNRGVVYMMDKHVEKSLKHFKIAYDLDLGNSIKELALHINLAGCYSDMGMAVRTITYLEREYHVHRDNNKASLMGLKIDNMLAVNYMYTNEESHAMNLLEACLAHARSLDYPLYIGIALHNLGCLYFKKANLEQALEHFNQAFEFLNEHKRPHLENVYQKARCLIEMRQRSEAKKIIKNAIIDAEDSEKYIHLFKSLSHLTTIKQKASYDYLLNTAIPKMLVMYEYQKALDFCQVLEFQLRECNLHGRVNAIVSISREIYKKIVVGGE